MTFEEERTMAIVEDLPAGEIDRATPKNVAVNPAYPRSWWMAVFSRDLKAGKVVPLRMLERDIVMWRDPDGVVYGHAAHCPHLGAHLGYGGEVVGQRLRCPFHAWEFDGDGRLVGQAGPDRIREGVCLPTFLVMERHGALFVWNGDGDPDIEFPDFLAFLSEIGANATDVTFAHHRWFLPFPAKWFAENLCDGMHFAVAHDAANWGDTIIHSESTTTLEMENALFERRPWLGLENVWRRFVRREMINLLTPVTNNIKSTCWGASIHLVRFAGRPRILGTIIACWLPVDSHSHYVMDVTLIPRIRIPILGRPLEKLVGLAAGLGNWSTAIQDAGLMMHRAEAPNPQYTSRDKGLVIFRRFWDSRIASNGQLVGDNLRSNGHRAGIRVKGRSPGVEPSVPSDAGHRARA
jgi:nitrite reductase/ring-hydroxylating ferredoxin subunit